MPGSGFAVTIKALDEASPVFVKLNRAIASTSGATKTFARQSGLFDARDALKDMSRSSFDLADRLGRVFTPLAGLGAAGSLAGIVALGKNFAAAGSEIGRFSATTGIATRDMQTWVGAGRIFGTSAESMKGALSGLNQQIYEYSHGQASDAFTTTVRQMRFSARTAVGLLDLHSPDEALILSALSPILI
jgi:hypothetical protein